MSTKPSQEWLDKYKETLVPEMFVNVSYHSTKASMQDDATPTSSNKVPFSNVAKIVNLDADAGPKYGTFEPNLCVLDGTCKVVPQAPYFTSTRCGYVSSYFVDDTSHSAIVLFTFKSAQNEEINGISIQWSSLFSEFASSFTLTAKNGTNVLLEKTVEGNTDIESFTEFKVSGFDSISIKVLKWCIPNRRARIELVEFGRKITFSKKDLLSYTHESKRDPISGQLSKDSISFSVYNSEQRWNPINPEGFYGYLYERQEVTVKYGMELESGIEWINGGKFFLSGWNVPSNGISASFEARDALSFLIDTEYTGRKYGTLYEMCYDALELLHVSGISYYISSELKNYNTDITSESSSYKNSDILQMAANAAGMALYQTRDGQIRIERIPYAVTDSTEIQEIQEINNYKYPEISYSSKIKNVSCKIGNETTFYPLNESVIGATQSVSNSMLTSDILAQSKNALTESYALLSNRRKATLEYRASPHNDAFDVFRLNHQFGYSSNLLATDIKYTFNGAFRGTVEGYMIENVSSVVLSQTTASIGYGEYVDVTATLVPSTEDSPAISWSASVADIVTLTILSSSAGRSTCRIGWNQKGSVTVTASVSGVSVSVSVECAQSAISQLAEGVSVYINHNGALTEYVVAKHDYESGLNGTGKTLLVSKNVDGTSAWNSSNQNTYANSTIDKLLNGDYLNDFSASMRAKITATKFYYTPGYSVSTSVSTLSRRVFLLSLSELSDGLKGYSGFNQEGTQLPCYKLLVQAPLLSSGGAYGKYQWTRTCVTDATKVDYPSSSNGQLSGMVSYLSSDESFDNKEHGYPEIEQVKTAWSFRAAFTIPETTELHADGSLIEE